MVDRVFGELKDRRRRFTCKQCEKVFDSGSQRFFDNVNRTVVCLVCAVRRGHVPEPPAQTAKAKDSSPAIITALTTEALEALTARILEVYRHQSETTLRIDAIDRKLDIILDALNLGAEV